MLYVEDGVGRKRVHRLRTERHPGFGIAGDCESTALEAAEWNETVTEGGRKFMASWREEAVDTARLRQKREASRLESCDCTRKRRTCEAIPICPMDESKESCSGARRTETCVASR